MNVDKRCHNTKEFSTELSIRELLSHQIPLLNTGAHHRTQNSVFVSPFLSLALNDTDKLKIKFSPLQSESANFTKIGTISWSDRKVPKWWDKSLTDQWESNKVRLVNNREVKTDEDGDTMAPQRTCKAKGHQVNSCSGQLIQLMGISFSHRHFSPSLSPSLPLSLKGKEIFF